MTSQIKSKKYMDLLRSGDSDKLSSSALWFHVANIAVTIVYIILGIAAYKMDNPNIEGMAIFTGVYAGIVTGNKFANTFLSYKYAVNKEAEKTEKTEEVKEQKVLAAKKTNKVNRNDPSFS